MDIFAPHTIDAKSQNASSSTSKNKDIDNAAFGVMFADLINDSDLNKDLNQFDSNTREEQHYTNRYEASDYASDSDYDDTSYNTQRSEDSDSDSARDAENANNDDLRADKANSKDTDKATDTDKNAVKADAPALPVEKMSIEQQNIIADAIEPKTDIKQAVDAIDLNAAEKNITAIINPKDGKKAEETTIGNILMLDGTELGADEGLLERLSAKIQKMQQDSDASGILFNLTPEQMTQLQKDIALAMETGDMPVPPEGFSFIMVNMAAPKGEQNADTADIALIKTLPFTNQPSLTGAVDGDVIEDQESAMTPLLKGMDAEGLDDLMDIQSSTDKFSALLKNAARLRQLAENAQGNQPQVQADNSNKNAENIAVQTGNTEKLTATAATLNGMSLNNGSLLTSLGWDSETLFQMGLATSGAPGQSVSQNASQLMNVATQARHASQAHPSTSMVAATLTKAAGNADNKAITLQLDPPELGRVEVRMEFGKDKTLKTTIISEKPEAHFMLQRDAQALERALQESGLEMGETGIEFAMSDGNENFNQDGRHDGSRNPAQAGEGNEEDGELIQIDTQMTWVIDPETGHTHYSILV